MIFVIRLLNGSASIEGGTAAGATSEAAENEVGRLAARMMKIARFDMFPLGIVFLDELDLFPKLTGDDGIAIILDCKLPIFERAIIQPVRPEGCIGVDGGEEMAGILNVIQ